MVKDGELLAKFEREDSARQGRERTYEQALQLMESLWQEAHALGSINTSDPLRGLEADIELARTLNALPHLRHV